MTPFRLFNITLAGLEAASAQPVGTPTDELDKLSVAAAPAALFVLTGEDIRRSRATSIPEALRWLLGLSVF